LTPRLGSLVKILDQPCGCTEGSVSQLFHVSEFRTREISSLEASVEVIFGFRERTPRDSDEAGEFSGAISAESFGDVPRCRCTGSADLSAVIDILGRSGVCSRCKDLALEFASQLPGNEILMATHTHANGISMDHAQR
jgi:hypothetical protein